MSTRQRRHPLGAIDFGAAARAGRVATKSDAFREAVPADDLDARRPIRRCLLVTALLLVGLSGAEVASGLDGDLSRVSVASDGRQAAALVPASVTTPSISSDGRYVAFTSDASDLVDGDTNGEDDVFVRDRQTSTTTVSVASDGTQGDKPSTDPEISRDGRYVAFASEASTLVAGDENGFGDVFLHDRTTGTTIRVSVGADGVEGDRPSGEPSLDGNATLVAFSSEAGTMAPGEDNGFHDVFVRDPAAGTTTLVSPAADGGAGDQASFSPVLSGDGKVVAFSSVATNLVEGDRNNSTDVFVRALAGGRTERVSVNAGGQEGNDGSAFPALDDTGGVVAFFSGATNLTGAPDTNNSPDLFVHQRGPAPATERISVAADGAEADGVSYSAVLSGDGMSVAFTSEATNLAPGDTNHVSDVFLRSRGPASTTRRISTDPAGAQLGDAGAEATMTPDGRLVAFTNLRFDPDGDGEAHPATGVLVAEPGAGTTQALDVTGGGHQPGGPPQSGDAAISADGRVVAFVSTATDLVTGDSNGAGDVFVHDTVTGETARVSVGPGGAESDADSWGPRLSADGRFVTFASDATNLVAGDGNDATDVFVHDRQERSTVRVSVAWPGPRARAPARSR